MDGYRQLFLKAQCIRDEQIDDVLESPDDRNVEFSRPIGASGPPFVDRGRLQICSGSNEYDSEAAKHVRTSSALINALLFLPSSARS